jgi:hypothetical protein
MLPFPGYGKEVLSPIPWSAGVSGICKNRSEKKLMDLPISVISVILIAFLIQENMQKN